MDTIYKEHILELYSEKPNYGELNNFTHQVSHKNPICNDEIIIDLIVEEGKIIDAKYHGISCFVSTIAASAILEKIKGMKIEEVKLLSQKDVDEILGVNIISTRIACELLPLEALKKL